MAKLNTDRKAKSYKLKIRQGDTVMIVAGKDRGQIGTVVAVSPSENKVIVVQENPENPDQPRPLNAAIKHKKARYQGERSARYARPAPLDASNVMLVDPSTNEPTRIGRRVENGKIVRYAKKSGQTLVDSPNLNKE